MQSRTVRARTKTNADADPSLVSSFTTRLQLTEHDDEYEREADQIADQVVHMRQTLSQSKTAKTTPSTLAQRKPSGRKVRSGTAPPIVRDVLASPGAPLDAATRAFFEPRFGHDFGNVRIHADATAAESARAVEALAYTGGEHIVFGRELYAPESAFGTRVLAHELTHVIQQSATQEPSYLQRATGVDPSIEKEDEPIPLQADISGTHEIVIDGQPYQILVTANLESLGVAYQKFRPDVKDYLGTYPNLGGGIWAFILDKISAGFCPIKGNCLGWAIGTFGVVDPSEAVWDRIPEYAGSIGLKVSPRRTPLEAYQKQITSEKLPRSSIWDYYMQVAFNALPTDSEADATLALYGRGFNLPSEGPSHIAFQPKGGNLWLSKPSFVKPPVLHENAHQMSGGEMGEVIRYYKLEKGPVDHVYLRSINSQPD